MTEYRKHHILPKTYLKYFTQNDSGKGIITLDIASQKQKAEYKNQGDKIFWGKYYYKDTRLEDSLAIEKYFGRIIEPTYNDLIKKIRLEVEIKDWGVKLLFLQWLIFSKLRSPVFRNDFEMKLRFQNKINKILPKDSSFIISEILANIDNYSKEFHLDHFIDDTLFDKTVGNIISGLIVKKWKILRTPNGSYFWTSDNPGFSLNIDQYEKTKILIPSKYLENFTCSSIHYYPLTKDYCLEFGPYMKGESVNLNLETDSIKFEMVDRNNCCQINKWTTLTACNFLIMDENMMK